jgi:hypothetical protein
VTADQKREGMAGPRWTIGDATEGWLPTVVLEDGLYFCRTYYKSDAERIVAALNAQAPPPPAEPLTPIVTERQRCIEAMCPFCRVEQPDGADCNREPSLWAQDGYVPNYGSVEAGTWLHGHGTTRYCKATPIRNLPAAAPPPQPETLAADAIVERCAAIVESSPTLQKHIQLCFCPECTYVRGNVTEIRALKGTLALAQPEKVTPPSDAPGGEK